MRRWALPEAALTLGLDSNLDGTEYGGINDGGMIFRISDSSLRERLEACLSQHSSPETADETCAAQPDSRDFNKEVHSWNPKNLIFSRSPKE